MSIVKNNSLYSGLLLALLWVVLGGLPARAAETLPRFEVADCLFEPLPDETITCGYVVVPENRRQPTERTVRVSVTLVKSHSLTPDPDPIVYLDGGPGGISKNQLDHLSQYNAWLAKRDLILFDQRGAGWSQPSLDCPDVTALWLAEAQGATFSLAEQLPPRLRCRDRWLAQGIDLTAYNSAEIAADTVDVWQALGYEQINLYGISYGTIPAQIIMRDTGVSGQIRSVILDGAVPLGVTTMADMPAQVNASMRQLFETCAADILCRTAYPNLASIYYQTIERLKTTPVTLSGTNPLNGQPFSFLFDVTDFGYLIQYGAARTLPATIYDIYDGNYADVIKGQEQFIRDLVTKGPTGNRFVGLRTTIQCNERYAAISAEQRAAMAVYPEAVFMDNPVDEAICEQWPAFTPSNQHPATGGIPTLVLTGEYDLRLTASYGQKIVDTLSQGYAIRVPGAGHTVLLSGGPCPNLLALAFLDDPTRPPNEDCLLTAGPPRFDTRFVLRAAAARGPAQMIIGLLAGVMIGLIISGGWHLRQSYRLGLSISPAWLQTWRLIGWGMPLVTLGVLGLVFYATQTHLLPLRLVNVIVLTLPLLVALQAAWLFSPEDEPALEVMLATPRPPAWTLFERLLLLFAVQGSVALVAGVYLSSVGGESMALTISRWLPPLFFLSGIAVYLTITTRRAIFGVLVVSLVWFALTLFGEMAIERWPVVWPLHLYLQPGTPNYGLNRLLLTLLGLSLLSLALRRLQGDPEQLLLGQRRSRLARSWWPSPPPSPRRRGRLASSSTEGETNIPPLGGPGGLEPATNLTPLPLQGKIVDSRFSLSQVPYSLMLTQLLAIIRYEFLLQWRRVALPMVVIGLMVTPVLGAVIAWDDFHGYRQAIAEGTLAVEVVKAEITTAMLPVMWLGALLITVLLVPLVVSDTIPKDRQLGVRELLDTLPLFPAIYLTGKLLSLWSSLLAGVTLAAFIAGLVWWLAIGPFSLGLFLHLWFIGALGLSLINGGTSLLLAAGQPSSRRALLVVGLYVLLCLIGTGFIFDIEAGWWRWLNPARPMVVLYYWFGFPGAVTGSDDWTRAGVAYFQQATNSLEVLLALGAGFIQVGLVWLLVTLKSSLEHGGAQRNHTNTQKFL